MQPLSTEQFSALPFVEKKAMLDFAHEQMDEFASLLAKEKLSGTAGRFQAKFDKWTGIRNALILECEMHVEMALGGADSSLPALNQ